MVLATLKSRPGATLVFCFLKGGIYIFKEFIELTSNLNDSANIFPLLEKWDRTSIADF